MKLTTKKFGVFATTLALSLLSVGVITAPAQAADCPYPVTSPTSNDNPKANIRLVSPTLTDSNSIRRYDFEGQFTLDCDWFGVGMRFNQVYVPFGLNTTVTFQATSMTGAPLVNQKVTLRANKGYSSSNANIRVNGIRIRAAGGNGADGGFVAGYTDVNGMVSFVVTSPDDCEAYGGVLPAAPLKLDSDTPNDRNANPSTDCFSQLLPSINGEKLDSADFVELHYFNSSALDYSADEVEMNLLAPALNETNSIANNGYVQAYVPIATKKIIAFQALKPDGTWARNVDVKVRVNLGNTGANAKVSAGIVGNTANGASTVLTPADVTKVEDDQLVLTGKTDAFGIVTFQLSNLDTVAPAPPATKTTPVPETGFKFAKVFAELVTGTTTGSHLDLHYYKPVPPTSITITASGRKITVTINNAVGKTSTVSITGKAKATLKPTVAKKVLTYSVTKGVKKVTVTANGKTLTKTFTIR
ncbi:MAG: hypothetical protein RLZZ556_691 [Actinomycetota bacterium]